jgi:peptidyl-prolyl cis-trans isomerase SurA
VFTAILQFKGRWFPALILVGAAVWGLFSPLPCSAEVVDRIVAVVNDDIILLSEWKAAINDYRKMLKESGRSDDLLPLSREQKSQLLDKMIEDKLVDQEAKRLGITISDEQVDDTIEHIRRINKISKEDMLRMMQLKGMTLEEYRKQIKEQLMQSRIVNREVKSKVVVTDEDVKQYYQAHQAQYAGQTKYHLRRILMRVPSKSPEDRERVYQQMQQLRDRLKAGADFAGLAKVYSQASTAADGGDLGFLESRLLANNIRQALEGKHAGDYTDVIETGQGYQLFYVQEVVHDGGKRLKDVKEEIYQKLSSEMIEQKFHEWFKALRQQAHIEKLDETHGI